MAWFRRKEAGIQTSLREQNEVPEGQWVKCSECGEILNRRKIQEHVMVCPECGYHLRIGAHSYFRILFDDKEFELYDQDLRSTDALNFKDRKSYEKRLEKAQEQTGLNEAAQAATGKVGGHPLSVAALDFNFIGGSMGSVVGEVVARAIKRAGDREMPLLLISQSGGARMMEGALSLMQMAKTSAHLSRLDEQGLPFISLMTHPTTGGVTASFAMLGDFNIAEPGALVGFAGPRVIRETIGSDLPDGFQRSEFLEEHGFLDLILDRRHIRERLSHLLDLLIE